MKLNHPLYRFIITAFSIYIIWFILYDHILKPHKGFDEALSSFQADITAWILRLLGYDCKHVVRFNLNLIYMNGERLLKIGHACNGQVLYPLYAGFIISTPGKIIDKSWFIGIGFLIILIMNIIRMCALCLTQLYAPDYLDFNHHYTFTILVYSGIFLMWMVWIKRNSQKKQPDEPVK